MLYWRQKVLMILLSRMPQKKSTKIQLVKLMFLLKQEGITRHGSFYDFLPYKYGPFSFSLYKELGELERLSCLKSSFNDYHLQENTNVKEFGQMLKEKVVNLIEAVVQTYGSLSSEKLVQFVYEKYPWFASRSERKNSCSDSFLKKKENPKSIYAMGYEGLSIDEFLNVLLREEIQTVLDTRNNPISRKYGFSKSALKKKCQDVGLQYLHFPEVGIPSNIRVHNKERQSLWKIYQEQILPENEMVLGQLSKIICQEKAVLICFEEHFEDCHRHLLAQELSTKINLPIFHYDHKEELWLNESRF
mgnify:CR=1 FL=1